MGVSESYYVSITKCKANGCYFQTDDLDEDDPKNIGEIPNETWLKPYLLFYTIRRQDTTNHANETLQSEFVCVGDVETVDLSRS